jgi:hypothetical protein
MPRPAQFDMVFLDHLKPLYTIDLKILEEEGLVGPVSRLSIEGTLQYFNNTANGLYSRVQYWSRTMSSNPGTRPTSLGYEPPLLRKEHHWTSPVSRLSPRPLQTPLPTTPGRLHLGMVL